MEPQSNVSFTKVTPLSKALAAILFIALPFVGLYVGYTFAPEKVVEIEKVVYQEFGQKENWPMYVVSEDFDFSLDPFYPGYRIAFTISAQRGPLDPFFAEHVELDPVSKSVVMSGYWYGEEGQELLQFYDINKISNIELFIEDAELNLRSTALDLPVQETEYSLDQAIEEGITRSGGEIVIEDVPRWRDYCELWNDGNKYSLIPAFQIRLVSVCSTGVYETYDDLLLLNTGRPIDATEPKIVPGSVKVYKVN